MLRKKYLYSRYIAALALVVSSICSVLVSPVVNAVSPFDNVIDKTSTLKISGANGACTTDISNTWSDLLQQASIGGSQFPYQGQAYLTSAYNQLLANQTTGSGWALWQVEYQGKYSVQLVIFPPNTDFYFQYAADNVTPVLDGYYTMTNDELYFIEMSMYDCNPFNLKYTVRGESYVTVSEFSDRISYQNSDNPTQSNYMYETKLFALASGNITYPSLYAGEAINVRISGSAACAWGDTVITNIRVDADTGVDGNAGIISNNYAGKDYVYYLSELSNYHIYVYCDGNIASTPTVNVTTGNPYTPQNWGCVDDSEGGFYICHAI